jgi:hypothetical protein
MSVRLRLEGELYAVNRDIVAGIAHMRTLGVTAREFHHLVYLYSRHYFLALAFAHRAFCARLIFLRAAADILLPLRDDVALAAVVVVPVRPSSA